MSEISPLVVENTYLGFHSHYDAPRVVGILREFDRWSKVKMNPKELMEAQWWFKPDDREDLVKLLNQNGALHTAGEVARNFIVKLDEVKALDSQFTDKILSIKDYVGKGGELPPIIMVSGRNPWATPSIIEGYHRCLGVCLADLEALIPGKKFEVYLGRKKLF